jgi:hypothetical protein
MRSEGPFSHPIPLFSIRWHKEKGGCSMAYHREKAVAYAHQWAFRRNPRYLDFTASAETARILSPNACWRAAHR